MKMFYVAETAKNTLNIIFISLNPLQLTVLGEEGTKPRTMQGRIGTPSNETSKHFRNFPRDIFVGTTVIRANVRPK
jgi:hypothetical protein